MDEVTKRGTNGVDETGIRVPVPFSSIAQSVPSSNKPIIPSRPLQQKKSTTPQRHWGGKAPSAKMDFEEPYKIAKSRTLVAPIMLQGYGKN
jgi:hypothetical protein